MLELELPELQMWKIYRIPYDYSGRIDLIAYNEYGSVVYAKPILDFNGILCPYDVNVGINSSIKINDLSENTLISLPTIDSCNFYLNALGYK